ncbi:MAG TPA: 4-alpha-glucanotransferase, partial [Burkholderiaceae bacterium]|nr:4-alpha-glucanotransferase [Burkholderiaceae bacterium]
MTLLDDTEIDGLRHEARLLELELDLQAGYHRLELRSGDRPVAQVLVIMAPPRCFQPPFLAAGARVWGLAVQLYGLRSDRNWGVGDFGDLAALVDVAASRGASAIGLNPLHSRFAHEPDRVSPYAPSSRLWLDVLALDVEAIDDFAENEDLRRRVRAPEFRAQLQALRSTELVDYRGVSAIKHEVLGEMYRHFRREHLARDTARAAGFRRFQAAGGRALRRHALFETLQQWLHGEDPSIWGWQVWPQPWRGADEEALCEFERQRLEQIEYHEYLQWQADSQLAGVSERCRERRMAIGLYLDLAVSVDRSGSDCWSFSHCYASAASVGAPPDEFNPIGQDWGLPPLIPEALRACGHAPFVLGLRANMRHAGALRIDHVMGLMRLYWVPPGATAREGAYVGYPVDEMLAIVRLESHRNRCLVVGEDLGTVPDAIRAALADAGVLSCRLLYFERDGNGEFLPPQSYPRDALVSVGTHDLPTLAGWWSGQDLQLRGQFGLFPDAEMQQAQLAGRAEDRQRLVAALRREGLLGAGAALDTGDAAAPGPALVDAVHAYLARTPASLMLVQPEDWLGVVDQNNVPGTVDEHPNWRRKLPIALAPGTGAAGGGAPEEADPAGERL